MPFPPQDHLPEPLVQDLSSGRAYGGPICTLQPLPFVCSHAPAHYGLVLPNRDASIRDGSWKDCLGTKVSREVLEEQCGGLGLLGREDLPRLCDDQGRVGEGEELGQGLEAVAADWMTGILHCVHCFVNKGRHLSHASSGTSGLIWEPRLHATPQQALQTVAVVNANALGGKAGQS